jgi:hypothetical protein
MLLHFVYQKLHFYSLHLYGSAKIGLIIFYLILSLAEC